MSARIEKRGEAWTVRWHFRGRYGRRKCPDRNTAKKLVREIEACHAEGRHWVPFDKSHPVDPCLTEAIRDRIESGRRTRRPNTLENWKVAFVLFVDYLRTKKPRGKLDFDMLSERNLLGFFDWLEARGNSASTVNLRLTQIRAFWKWSAESSEWMDYSPRYVHVELPVPEPPRRKQAPTWAEADMMLGILETKRGRTTANNLPSPRAEACYRAAVIMRYTGLRKSQAIGVRWEDFDMISGRLFVRPSLGKSRNERRGRTIPVCDHLIEAMAGWGVRSGYVTTGTDEQLNRVTFDYAIKAAWKASQVDPSKWKQQTAHALRRSFTSELVSRGADRFAVELLLGRSTGVGGDVYTDPTFIWDRLSQAVSMVKKIGVNADKQTVFGHISSQ